MARKTPDLNLQPEEQKVLSTDFNLFYRPQEAPLPAGMKEFTNALDNFVNGGATKAVLGAEVKMKKSERAKALKDYNENKGKFRDAVKNGEIDKTANPYYLEKYKELTLNSFANEFTETILQNYENSGVKKDLTEGAFEKFYKENLGKFIKEKNLGFFQPEELENGFFKETSAYRNQLEATHKQNLLNEFNKDFDNKIKDRIVGTVEKFKTWDTDQLSEGEIQQGLTKWDKISEVLQGEIQSLFDVTGNGRDVVDTIFDGLELYVTSTDDYEFALQLIQQIPKRLIAGTDTIANIGRLKNKQQELKDLLIEKQNEKLNNEVQFEKNKDNITVARTHNFLEETIKNNPHFNLTQWINDKGRTDAERIAGEQYKKSLLFDGGNSDDTDTIKEIEKLLNNNEYAEASKLAYEALESGKIRKATYQSYKSTVIPNAQNLEGNVYFDDIYISGQFKAFEKIITSGVSDTYSEAITVRATMRKKLLAWLSANADNPKYEGELGEIQKQEDFNAEFDKNMTLIKKTDQYNSLFGKGQFELTGKSSVQILEEKMEVAEKNTITLAQKIADASIMSPEGFLAKYGVALETFKKENNIK
jgi:hypothetical protein